MSRSIEVKLAAHQAAAERRAAGKPTWDEEIHFPAWTNDQSRPFAERRDEIVRILRASQWAKADAGGGPLDREIDDLADAYDEEEFAEVISEIYDRADVTRIWITVDR